MANKIGLHGHNAFGWFRTMYASSGIIYIFHEQ